MTSKSSAFDLELNDDTEGGPSDSGGCLSALGIRHTICFLISALLFVTFLLVGIVTFAVGCSEYNREKSLYDSNVTQFQSPTASVLALHWLFWFFATLASGLFVWGAAAGLRESPLPRILIMLASTLASIACYIAYLYLYFTSAEFKATGNGLTHQGYEAWKRRMVVTNPQFEIDAKWTELDRHCYTKNPFAVQTDSSNDSSIFPVLGQDDPNALYHVFTTVTIELAPGDYDVLLENYKTQVLQNCKPMLWPISSSATIAPGMLGLARDQFVSATGELPAKLRRGPAVAAGIFFAGVIHSYWVTAIPPVNAYIIKTNVTLGRFGLSCGFTNILCNSW